MLKQLIREDYSLRIKGLAGEIVYNGQYILEDILEGREHRQYREI